MQEMGYRMGRVEFCDYVVIHSMFIENMKCADQRQSR